MACLRNQGGAIRSSAARGNGVTQARGEGKDDGSDAHSLDGHPRAEMDSESRHGSL